MANRYKSVVLDSVVAGGYHDLTPIHELTCTPAAGACVFGDKGYNSGPDEAAIFDETHEFLKAHASPGPSVERDGEKKDTLVRANREILAHAIRLEHH